MQAMIFRNREQAGRLLGEALEKYGDRQDVLVLGLPRGGVPVAYEVAKILNAPLDVLVVRKLGLPGWEELAMGAIASGGIRVLNDSVVKGSRVPRERIEKAVSEEMEELHRREIAFRGHTKAPDVEGKAVILVDDGIATGSTIRAAVSALRQQHPASITIAVPTAAPDTCRMLESLVDELVVLSEPSNFQAVGQWYEDFSQTQDAEVKRLLADAAGLMKVSG